MKKLLRSTLPFLVVILCGCATSAPVEVMPSQIPALREQSVTAEEPVPLAQEQGTAVDGPIEQEQSAAVDGPIEQEKTIAPAELPAVSEQTNEKTPAMEIPVETECAGSEEKNVEGSAEDAALSCTLSISCNDVLNNMDALSEEKRQLLADDGWVLAPVELSFSEGESVFDVLRRTCEQQKIHLEFEDTPLYNSAYIEGICNLYEFDCGRTSGWMYTVNGQRPNRGCSQYTLSDGDVVRWEYACDLSAK